MKTRQVAKRPLYRGSTLTIVLGVCFVLLFAGVGCSAGPGLAEADTVNTATPTAVEPTETSEPTATPMPTATEVPPTETPTPGPWDTWPDLVDMPDVDPIIPESRFENLTYDQMVKLREDEYVNELDHTFLSLYSFIMSAEDSILITLSDISRGEVDENISGAILDYYSEMFIERFENHEYPIYLAPVLIGSNDSGLSPSNMVMVDLPFEQYPNILGQLPSLSAYLYLTSSHEDIALFVEDSILRGYGREKQGVSKINAVLYMVYSTGFKDGLLYFSNFDPTSRDFLAMTRQVGEEELYREVLETLEELGSLEDLYYFEMMEILKNIE